MQAEHNDGVGHIALIVLAWMIFCIIMKTVMRCKPLHARRSFRVIYCMLAATYNLYVYAF